MEIQNRLRNFLEPNYPLSSEAGNFSSCPVEFYGDYFKEPMASGSRDQTIKLWHPHVGNPVPANCKFPVTSPDRFLLVQPNYDETTETWNLEIIDAATGKLLETLPGHSGSIEQVIFSEDGNTMVSLGGDLVIKVWRQGDG